MTRKTSTTELPIQGAEGEINLRRVQTRLKGQGPQNGLTSGGGLAMSAIGMGLAVQLAATDKSQAGEAQGQGRELPQVNDAEKVALAVAGGLMQEPGGGAIDLAAGSATAEHVISSQVEEGSLEVAPVPLEGVEQAVADAPSFAPRLDADQKADRLDVTLPAQNVTLPDRTPAPSVVGGGVVDSILGENGLVADLVDGVVDGVLDPILGADGILGSVLDPILGSDGIVQGVLDPILGEGGVVDSLLDPILGEGGLVDELLDPVQGVVGDLIGTVGDGLLDPVLGQDGVIGDILDPVLGQDGLVGSILGPILGGDGLLSSALAPVVGEDGLVGSIAETVLDPVLGDNGIADSVLDPLIGGDGVISNVIGTVTDGVIEPILGEHGLAGTILNPLIGDDGVLSYVLNPLIGEGGVLEVALDPVLGDDGLLPTLLDPILGENGLLGGVLDPLVGADGILDTVLTPVLDATGPLGGLVDGLLGGLFGGWRNRRSAGPEPEAAKAQAVAEPEVAGQDVILPALAGNEVSTDGVQAGVDDAGDEGFLDSLIGSIAPGAGVIDFDSMASALSQPGDMVFATLMDGGDISDAGGALPEAEDLLGSMLGIGLSGQLVDEVGAFDAANDTPDLDLDTLLNGIIDSGDSAVEGVADPIGELIATDVADDVMGNLGEAVDGALNQILGDLEQLADLGSDLGAGLMIWPDLTSGADDSETV